MKKIMILGGDKNQLPLIEKAKELGYYVVLCDFRDYVKGIALCDVHYQIDTLNPDSLVEVGRKESPDGILTNSEPTFVSMATAAAKLGLPCLSLESTNLYKNKFLMREFCRNSLDSCNSCSKSNKQALLSPRYRRCSDVDAALDFFNTIQKKCIIKPLDNSASRGVFSVNSSDDIRLHFDQCLSASSTVNPAIIIEEYVTGTEFTVDGLMTPHGHRCLAISEKKHYPYNENVACQLLFENTNSRFDYALLRRLNDNLVNLTGIPFGLTHAEYKFSDGNFYLIEIQARGGGSLIATDIVPFISGIDSYKEQLRWAVGDKVEVDFDYENLSQRCAVLHFFDVPGKGGVVKDIKGLDFFDSLGDQLIYNLRFHVGDTVCETIDDSTRIGWYILKCDDRSDLDKKMKMIDNNFKIII